MLATKYEKTHRVKREFGGLYIYLKSDSLLSGIF